MGVSGESVLAVETLLERVRVGHGESGLLAFNRAECVDKMIEEGEDSDSPAGQRGSQESHALLENRCLL